MANSLQRLVTGGKDVRFAANGRTRIAYGTPLGFWLFNRFSGESSAAAYKRCVRNRIIGAANKPEDHILIGAPVVDPAGGSWRWTAADALVLSLYDIGDFTVYAVARSQYATLGSTAPERAHIAGTFGNTANKGASMVFNSMSQVRGITYQNPTTPEIKTHDVNVPTASVDKWRIYRGYFASSSMRLKNCSLDSTDDEPTATALPDGRILGPQPFSIGARMEGNVVSPNYVGHCDIAALLIMSGAIGTADETPIINQMRAQLKLAGIIEMSA
ncbi:hypothetical protein OIU34_02310 [Pararhizobium sp. BT-229]|uniref:hypothetical protein n=1 Tax=Pararhizobium sp. BT-229 TaxID=2986923 RepID=UPI0021F6A159|nr:hypothetical protein [Pararhizobium sp. BT-229]MCV9960720.1 hypothetical protein [Pararhizobium sp. BT-229]